MEWLIGAGLVGVALWFALRRSSRLSAAAPVGRRAAASGAEVVNSFPSKVVGITRRNDDGSDRQALAAGLTPGDELHLVPEPENPYDKHAIAVLAPSGRQLGYLPERTARDLGRRLRRDGTTARCTVMQITGGGRGQSVGVNVTIDEVHT